MRGWLRMRGWLQTQLFGPYPSSYLALSYGDEFSNDPKSVLKLLDFRYGPILGQPPGSKQMWRPRALCHPTSYWAGQH